MIVQHWIDDESQAVFPKKAYEQHMRFFVGKARLCCEIEGDSWEDCMRQYHEHRGWEPYVPFNLSGEPQELT